MGTWVRTTFAIALLFNHSPAGSGTVSMALRTSAVLALPLGAAEPVSTITVFVYNYAALSSDTLAQIKAEAARIYGHSGIEIKWLDCPRSPREADQFPACQVPPGPTRLMVRILSSSMAERMRQARDCFGFALHPEDGSFATVANVFANHADQIANRHHVRQGAMLGHMVAHELGHLLLGAGSHASIGIMHVPWHPKEFESVAQGSMMFAPGESRKMRVNLRARLAAETAEAELGSEPALPLTLRIYAQTDVPRAALDEAKREIHRIFRTAGIEALWLDCPAGRPPDPACGQRLRLRDLAIRILGGLSSSPIGHSLGSSLIVREGFSRYAAVLYGEIRAHSDGEAVFEGRMLGYTIAHEVGHLLLGSDTHSPAGIMTTRWNIKVLRSATRKTFSFTKEQAEELQANVRARLAAETAALGKTGENRGENRDILAILP